MPQPLYTRRPWISLWPSQSGWRETISIPRAEELTDQNFEIIYQHRFELLQAKSVLTSERVERRERHGQSTQHDVGYGQVDDEYVSDGAHVLVGPHHVYDQYVAEHAQREYKQIDERERGLKCGALHVFTFDGFCHREVGGISAVRGTTDTTTAQTGWYVYGRENVGLQRFEPAATAAVRHDGSWPICCFSGDRVTWRYAASG